MKHRSWLSILLVAGSAGAVQAGIVSETELPGGFANNSTGTAQALPGASFTTNMNPNVFGTLPTATVLGQGGSGDIDFYEFSVASTSTAYFDMDSIPFNFDPILSLFNSAGTLLAFCDDSSGDLGSVHPFDSFLGVVTLAPGTYFIAVSQFANFPTARSSGTLSTLFRPDAAFGGQAVAGATFGDSSFVSAAAAGGSLDYRLEISLENPVLIPLPPGVGMGMAGLAGLACVARLRRRA